MTKNSGKTSWAIYKRLLSYTAPYWGMFAISFVGYALYGVSQGLSALWIEKVVDAVQQGQLDQRIFLALAVLGIYILRGISTFVGNYSISYVARSVVHQLRVDLFEKLLLLPSSYYHHHPSGELLARLTYNVEQVTEAVSNAVKVLLREGLTVVGLFGLLFYLNWKLTLIFLISAPFIGYVVKIASKRMRMLGERIQRSVGDITSSAAETIKGYQVVRAFGGSDFEKQRFHKASERNRRQSMKLVVAESVNTPVVQLLVAVALAILLYFAMHPSVMGGMSTGEFVAYITAAAGITKPLRLLTNVNSIIQRGVAASEAIFATLDEVEERDTGTRSLKGARGELQFSQLSFDYLPKVEGQRTALNSITLDVPAGKTLALVGRSGSGKSTLVDLIPRFNDGWQGQLTLDGVPLQEYRLEDLRSQVAIVNQNVVLFDGTIGENIAYGSMSAASQEQIMAAAEAAHVTEFLENLPEGLNTQVGESGTLLSGGQRQRIAIARAILKDAPILILDEATSALDSASERHIQAAMQQVMAGRTTLVIAHRLSTIEDADQIAVMDSGEIVEVGTHQELLERGGAYTELHRLQFGNAENSA